MYVSDREAKIKKKTWVGRQKTICFKEEHPGVKASCSTGSEHSVALSDKQWDTYSRQKIQ